MIVQHVMSRDVRTVTPEATIREAARIMADADVGALPVAAGDRLAGMVTDRDIAIRAVAVGKGPETTVGEVMTHDVLYCHEDEDVHHVSDNMGEMQVRRLPVVDVEKRLVGIVSLADIALAVNAEEAGEALEGIARPGGERSQSIDGRA
ncbi:CBS domain-containing protein [Terricaulis silvestris]|uniref:Hypoxic response protein 1 n=1 Tax=Terricaulis silvestris TaxID=2686094 RepID=A0A6I6MJ64_9CAUL|nr:CBS domain-containing protein [Terricaulis silvestris]QGZ95180.1 Hypoxic response protein 1 [Terricaulis silvestris]